MDHILTLTVLSNAGESKDQKSRRMCRNGCGIERTPGRADTPGFRSQPRVSIIRDPRGHKRFSMPRPARKEKDTLIQTSIYLSQSWRANCDFQIMYYESGHVHPSAEDIARVTDYIVAYACKGIESIEQEKQQIKGLIYALLKESNKSDDIRRVARQILNRSIGQKLISKQECMVQLAGLCLFECSEIIEDVSMSK